MKKIIQFLIILILLLVLTAFVVLFFNPAGLRDKFLASLINGYLSSHIEGYEPLETTASQAYDHPYLNNQQEAALTNLGVDVSKLPTSITPEMQNCFIEKLGQDKVNQIINGAAPSALDLYKAKDCL